MTDKETLEKAIQKAIDGGWKGTKFMPLGGDWLGDPPKWEVMQPYSDAMIIYTTGGVGCIDIHINTEHVIFNHEFAKALWGEGYYENKSPNYLLRDGRKIWQYHLQQMVISDNPLEYLREHM